MTTTHTHDDLTFTITVVSFPNAHIAIVRGVGSDYKTTLWRDFPSARLATENAIAFIERTF